jgi:hypothetical protein
LLIDPQQSLSEAMGEAAARVTNNLLGLARVAMAFSLPLVVTSRSGEGEVIPPIRALLPRDAVIERPDADVFGFAPLSDALQQLGRRVWFVARWGRGDALADAAIAGMRLRFEMRVVLDASSPPGVLTDNRGIARMTGAGIDMTSWVAILAALFQEQAEADIPSPTWQAIQENLATYAPAALGHWEGDVIRDSSRL